MSFLRRIDLFDDRRCIDWRAFADSMESWAKPLASMMSLALNSEPVNLTQGWKDKNNREISYDAIAHFFDVSWDGTVDSARLYMPPYIQQLLLAFLYPLTEYLDKVANCRISLNYATILEWACLKRFQELFDEHSQGCPHKVLPEFFTEHQLFGMCTGVQFSKHTCPVPTATQKWTPGTWWHMRARIENHLGDEYRLNLKPRLKSASPDALLMAKIHTKKLTVGLAVKNFPLGTSFGEDELKKEIEIFNKIFDIYESGDRLNVLIVCSTNYSVDLKTEFEASDSEGQRIVRNSAVYSIDGFPSIHEIILLNLSTPNLRAKFFGIQDESLQNMLESTIEKAQAEVESKK